MRGQRQPALAASHGGLQGDKDELRPSRPDGTAKPITSAKLYALANEAFAVLAPLNHAWRLALLRLFARGLLAVVGDNYPGRRRRESLDRLQGYGFHWWCLTFWRSLAVSTGRLLPARTNTT